MFFEDSRITRLRNYRKQLVALKRDVQHLAGDLSKAWTINDSQNGVSIYLGTVLTDIDNAIKRLDNDIAKANAILKKKD